MPLLIRRDATPPTHLESVQVDYYGISNDCFNQQDSAPSSDYSQDSVNVIMHCGFLRFTAKTAQLDIKQNDADNQEGRYLGELDEWVNVEAHDVHGERVGELRIIGRFLGVKETRPGECVLLSANVKDTANDVCKRQYTYCSEGVNLPGRVGHVDDCEHVESYNIMLIEWDGDIARRVGLGTVEQEAWENLEVCSKLIVLG